MCKNNRMNKNRVLFNIKLYEIILKGIKKQLEEVSKGIYKKSRFYKIKNRLLNNIITYNNILQRIKQDVV